MNYKDFFFLSKEPACSLQRERQIEHSICITCQRTKKEYLRCIESGLLVLKNAATVRQTFNDPKNRTAIENILSASQSKAFGSLEWHKTCYSLFTSKLHLDRLQ